MTRREIRDHKFKILFSLLINKEDVDKVIDKYFESLPVEDDSENSYVNSTQKTYENVNIKKTEEAQPDEDLDANESIVYINENEINEIKDFVKDILTKTDELDDKISRSLTDWKITRIPKAELTILRICLYEIYYTDLDTAVSINEAVLLSKVYGMSDDKSNKFMNAVLSTIIKQNG